MLLDKKVMVDTVKWCALQVEPAMYNTIEMSEYCITNKIPGDFVECGVFAGAQTGLMGMTLKAYGVSDKRIHLFDSFEGIPEAGPKDTQQPGIGYITNGQGRLISSNISVCSLESVKVNMEKSWGIPASMLVYHKGWFQNTVPNWDGTKISLLRLDGDLYESYMVCLKHLYPCLSIGGILLIDDWILSGCQRAVTDYFESIGEELNLVNGNPSVSTYPVYHIKTE